MLFNVITTVACLEEILYTLLHILKLKNLFCEWLSHIKASVNLFVLMGICKYM